MLEQGVERERQQPTCRLVTGDQEGDALGDDVVIIKFLARLAVNASQHAIEQVADGARRTGSASLFDETVHCLDHELLGGVALPRASWVKPALDRQLPC